MRDFLFYKEANGDWFVELPEWKGSKAELQMVSGADTMLEYMAEGGDLVWARLSEEPFVGGDEIKFVRTADEIGNGAHYKLDTYKGIEINLNLWLCDVTTFVFGSFPTSIYLASVKIN
jgi:hypothetical protein